MGGAALSWQNIQHTEETRESPEGGVQAAWCHLGSAWLRGSPRAGFRPPESGRGLGRASLWLLAKPGPRDRE